MSLLTSFSSPQPIPYPFTIPGEEQRTFLTWQRNSHILGVSKEDLQELIAEGWVPIDADPDKDVLPYLESHFSETLSLVEQGSTKYQTWVQTEDLKFAMLYPVLIACEGGIDEKYITLGSMPGSHAIIVSEDGKYIVYTLEQLGDAASAASEQIKQWYSPTIPLPTAINVKKRESKRAAKQRQQALALQEQGLRAIKELVTLYWQYHLNEQRKKEIIPPIPNIFKDAKQTDIPTSLAIRGILSAYSNAHSGATKWTQADSTPSYTYQHTSDTAVIEWRPIQTNIADLTKLLWHQVTRLSDLDGDVLLACMAQWMAEHDDTGATWITSEHILNYRGIQPRKNIDAQGIERPSVHRLEDLQAIQESIEHIRNTHVTTQQWVAEERAPGQRGRPKKRLLQLQSYVFTISDFLEQKTIFADDKSENLQIAWKYRPGACIESFVQGTNREMSQLFQQALAYDSYRELWEKRLARYFMLRLQSTNGGATSCSIGDLFAELSLPLEKRNPDRTKQRFEQALNRLVLDQIISSWQYQEDIYELPSKKWGEIWLSYHILVEAAPVIKSLEAQQQQSAPPTKNKKQRQSST